jgi:imidazolonepropionase-like amidohydrolase
MRLRQLMEEAEPPVKLRGSGRRKEVRAAEDEQSLSDEVMTDVRGKKLPVLAHAQRVDDILFALELADEYQLDLILLGAAEGHLVAGDLADAGVPVFLGPTTVQPSSFEHLHARYDNAAQLFAAGVKLGLRTGSAHRVRNLPTEAGIAVAHGLPFEAAIRALTANPAEVLGLSGLGRLELGSEATFFQASGDPLQPRTRIHQVWISGQPMDMSSRQTRLYQEFRELD